MAQRGPPRWSNLQDEASADPENGDTETPEKVLRDAYTGRPAMKGSMTSEDTIRISATPPIDIPALPEDAILDEPDTSFMERYMRTRQPSVSFNEEVKLESGQRQSIDKPLKKPLKERPRGRSLLDAMTEAKSKSMRAHSESDREHYDTTTGRHLPKYSTSPARERARLGEGRFPLLQTTVDEMARESHPAASQAVSMTSDSTLSPREEVHTPPEVEQTFSPFTGAAAFSYDEPKTFKRTASQRWREGGNSQSAQDFLSRAGSLRLGRTFSSGKVNRHDTGGSVNTPRSAASSYLRAFSMSSSTDGGDPSGPPAVDAEGQTIGEDYVLGKQIGYGGFSTIKEVTQMTSSKQRKLAVKIVRRQLDGKSEDENEQAQAEFEHEVELWRFLNHQHILPLEAVYRLDEATFCFIPLNTGGTLFDLVRMNRSGLPEPLAKSYTSQIASALRYLHLDARVVHRDIKLENCLLEQHPNDPTSPGLVRLCDFGMAEWLSADSSSSPSSDPPSPTIWAADRPPQKHIGPADTSTSAFAGGSLEYAAPEILRRSQSRRESSSDEDASVIGAERSIVSPAVDVWAFGVCVFSLVVGSRPFQNSFQPRVVMAILAGEWDRERVRGVGGDKVCGLVEGCLDMMEESRWDIARVVECRWLEDVVGWEGDGCGEKGWKL